MNMNELATLPQDPQEILKQAQHLIEITKGAILDMDIIIGLVRDDVIELLLALDEKQPSYSPKPNEWVVERLYGLLEMLDERKGGTQ